MPELRSVHKTTQHPCQNHKLQPCYQCHQQRCPWHQSKSPSALLQHLNHQLVHSLKVSLQRLLLVLASQPHEQTRWHCCQALIGRVCSLRLVLRGSRASWQLQRLTSNATYRSLTGQGCTLILKVHSPPNIFLCNLACVQVAAVHNGTGSLCPCVYRVHVLVACSTTAAKYFIAGSCFFIKALPWTCYRSVKQHTAYAPDTQQAALGLERMRTLRDELARARTTFQDVQSSVERTQNIIRDLTNRAVAAEGNAEKLRDDLATADEQV
jgi:hypothetical protein